MLPPPASSSRGERALWLVLTLAFLAAAFGDRVPWLRGPAPYPPEWQWPLRDTPVEGPVWPAIALAATIVGLLAASGSARAHARAERAACLLLLAGTLLGLALPLAIASLEPGGVLSTVFGRVAYRTATSYYTVALSPEAEDPLSFLRHHDELLPGMRKGAKHAATHPPGPVLVYRGLIALCDDVPVLTRAVLGLSGLPESNPRRERPEHSASSRAAGVLGALLILTACVLTAWPIASLARSLGCGPLTAARIAVLWAVLPGPVLMLPQFDQALALPVACSAAALARALAAADERRGLAFAALSGLAGGVAVSLSYGAPAFLAVGGLAVLAAALAGGAALGRALARCAAAAMVTVSLFFAPALLGHHPLASARVALGIHREFFTLPRDYRLWLAFDPLDLALFIGLPVAASLVVAMVAAGRHLKARARLAPDEAFRLGAIVALAALLLSGQTRGEVGRIWIPLMPILLVAALARPASGTADEGPSAASAAWLAAAVAPTTLVIALWWKFF